MTGTKATGFTGWADRLVRAAEKHVGRGNPLPALDYVELYHDHYTVAQVAELIRKMVKEGKTEGQVLGYED